LLLRQEESRLRLGRLLLLLLLLLEERLRRLGRRELLTLSLEECILAIALYTRLNFLGEWHRFGSRLLRSARPLGS
jgi:hypothetical protein